MKTFKIPPKNRRNFDREQLLDAKGLVSRNWHARHPSHLPSVHLLRNVSLFLCGLDFADQETGCECVLQWPLTCHMWLGGRAQLGCKHLLPHHICHSLRLFQRFLSKAFLLLY